MYDMNQWQSRMFNYSAKDSRTVVLNLGVATQNWAVENIPMGRKYFIKITLFLIFLF
jgi:hypothetical protein